LSFIGEFSKKDRRIFVALFGGISQKNRNDRKRGAEIHRTNQAEDDTPDFGLVF
jgi:hypothetical protein